MNSCSYKGLGSLGNLSVSAALSQHWTTNFKFTFSRKCVLFFNIYCQLKWSAIDKIKFHGEFVQWEERKYHSESFSTSCTNPAWWALREKRVYTALIVYWAFFVIELTPPYVRSQQSQCMQQCWRIMKGTLSWICITFKEMYLVWKCTYNVLNMPYMFTNTSILKFKILNFSKCYSVQFCTFNFET